MQIKHNKKTKKKSEKRLGLVTLLRICIGRAVFGGPPMVGGAA